MSEGTATWIVLALPFDSGVDFVWFLLFSVVLLPLVALLAQAWDHGRQWLDSRARNPIPDKWWPIDLPSGPRSTEIVAPPTSEPTTGEALLPRKLTAHELSFLAGNRDAGHLVALGLLELRARGVLKIHDELISSAMPPLSGLPPLLVGLHDACIRAGDGAYAADITRELRGGLFGERDRIQRWIAGPLVDFGLMQTVTLRRNGHDDVYWRPLPAGQAWVDWAGRVAAGVDSRRLGELAQADSAAALTLLQRLPPAVLLLMRPLHQTARRVATEMVRTGQKATAGKLSLALLDETQVGRGRPHASESVSGGGDGGA